MIAGAALAEDNSAVNSAEQIADFPKRSFRLEYSPRCPHLVFSSAADNARIFPCCESYSYNKFPLDAMCCQLLEPVQYLHTHLSDKFSCSLRQEIPAIRQYSCGFFLDLGKIMLENVHTDSYSTASKPLYAAVGKKEHKTKKDRLGDPFLGLTSNIKITRKYTINVRYFSGARYKFKSAFWQIFQYIYGKCHS